MVPPSYGIFPTAHFGWAYREMGSRRYGEAGLGHNFEWDMEIPALCDNKNPKWSLETVSFFSGYTKACSNDAYWLILVFTTG